MAGKRKRPVDVPEDVLAVKRWIRELRTQQKLTQAELAAVAGTSPRMIINLENEDDPGLGHGRNLFQVLKRLGVLVGAPESSAAAGLTETLAALQEAVAEIQATQENVLSELEALRSGGASASPPQPAGSSRRKAQAKRA